MHASNEMLTVREAAVIAGVNARVVNDAIDSKAIPAGLYLRVGRDRRIAPAACVFVAIYNEKRLARDFRVEWIRKIAERWSKQRFDTPKAPRTTCRKVERGDVYFEPEGWLRVIFEMKFWEPDAFVWRGPDGPVIDLRPVADKVERAATELDEAISIVTEDDDVMGGVPCIRNTRIPVHDVAASVRAGIPTSEILEAYPDLTEREVHLADLFSRAHPPRGRPRRVADVWPKARLTSEVRVRRRAA